MMNDFQIRTRVLSQHYNTNSNPRERPYMPGPEIMLFLFSPVVFALVKQDGTLWYIMY